MTIKPIFVNESSQGMRLLLVGIVAVSLMFTDFKFKEFVPFKETASLIVYPIQKVIDCPLQWLHMASNYLTAHDNLVKENNRLKEEQLIYRGKLQKLLTLEKENLHLKELMKSGNQAKEALLVANISFIEPDPFTHQVLLDKGTEHDVYIGQPVIDAHGVMGSIIAVNKYTSRVLLVTDGSHGVPVENHRNGIRAIAIGTSTQGRLELQYVPNTTDIKEGDLMVTSGLGGRFASGFPVGEVTEVQRDHGKPFATIVLSPCAQIERTRQVLLLYSNSATQQAS